MCVGYVGLRKSRVQPRYNWSVCLSVGVTYVPLVEGTASSLEVAKRLVGQHYRQHEQELEW